MEFIAKPVRVTAYRIEKISPTFDNQTHVVLDNGQHRIATQEMLIRIELKVGDYWVVQEDGYEYLNPKEVFERKYSRI